MSPSVNKLLSQYGVIMAAWARKSPAKMKHACAVLDRQERPICFGYNRGWIHAEEDAVLKYNRAYRPRGREAHSLLVIRWTPTKGWGMSKPCESCQTLIDRYSFRVLYTEG